MKPGKVLLLWFPLFLFIVSACTNNDEAGHQNFQFNLQKGKAYDYAMNFDIQQTTSGQDISTNMINYFSMEVVDDDGKLKTLKTTYQRFAMTATMAGRTIQADSDEEDSVVQGELNDPNQLMGAMFRALKGKSFTMKVDKEGKVVEVSGLQQIAEGMVNSMNLREEMKPMVMQNFTQQFNEQNIKELFSQSFNIFPNKAVKVGDSWEKKMAGTAALPMEMITTYTVTSMDGNIIKLKANSKMNNTTDASMTGEQTGTIEVNAKTGLVVNNNFEQKIRSQRDNQSFVMTTKGKVTGKER